MFNHIGAFSSRSTAGFRLNRSVTWWPKAKPFLEYLARGSFLLQRGRFVADVLYYYGDGGANFVGPRRNPANLGPGYDYDVTNADALLHRFSVRDGRLTLPDGMSYALLVLPDRDDLHPAVLEKIDALVRAGATVIGRRPTRATGLENFPASDARVRELAAILWGDLDGAARTSRRHGLGRVVEGRPERAVLAELGLGPDFVAPTALDFTHRRDSETDIYFVRNRTAAPVAAPAMFRVRDRAPELWDPINGGIVPARGFRVTETGTEVPLEFSANGSIFVVFRSGSPEKPPAAAVGSAKSAAPAMELPDPLVLDSDWIVDFSSPLGAPEPLRLAQVGPWTRQATPEVKYFSGSAKYRHTVNLPSGWRRNASHVDLELGHLWAIGEVWINGASLGVVWAPPFRVDATAALREGPNEIVVEVAGAWHNRLVGEARGALPKKTRTNISVSKSKAWKDLEPIETGLFGPVRLVPRSAQKP